MTNRSADDDVPMAGRDLARQDHLQTAVETLRDLRLAADAGILEHEHAALGFLGRQQAAGFHEQRTQLVVPPQHRAPSPAWAMAG